MGALFRRCGILFSPAHLLFDREFVRVCKCIVRSLMKNRHASQALGEGDLVCYVGGPTFDSSAMLAKFVTADPKNEIALDRTPRSKQFR